MPWSSALTPICLINSYSVLELEMVRALWRVSVEECAAEGHLVDWSVCLSAELILPADEVSLSAHNPALLQYFPYWCQVRQAYWKKKSLLKDQLKMIKQWVVKIFWDMLLYELALLARI